MTEAFANAPATLYVAPAPIPVIKDATWNQDLTQADGTDVVWPVPRNPKIDVAVVLKIMFGNYGITTDMTSPTAQIPIFTNGAFRPTMLRSQDGKSTNRPVIVVNLSSDVADRTSIGEQFGAFDPDSLQDGSDLIGPVVARGEASNATVDITIYDENEQRADQLYVTVKTFMIAAQQEFANVGYTKPPIRVSGSHSASLQIDAPGGTMIVFQRDLSYEMQHLDFILGVSQVVSLIAEQLTATGPGGDVTLPPVDV